MCTGHELHIIACMYAYNYNDSWVIQHQQNVATIKHCLQFVCVWVCVCVCVCVCHTYASHKQDHKIGHI